MLVQDSTHPFPSTLHLWPVTIRTKWHSDMAVLPFELFFNCNLVLFARSSKTIIMKVTYQQVLSAWTWWQTQWGLLSLCQKYFSIYKAAKLSDFAINGKSVQYVREVDFQEIACLQSIQDVHSELCTNICYYTNRRESNLYTECTNGGLIIILLDKC